MQDVLAQLPSELHCSILSRLPADNAIQCKLVCKTWRNIVEDPDFTSIHTRQLYESGRGNSTATCDAASKEVSTFYVRNKLADQRQRPSSEQGLCVEYNADAGGNDQGIHFKVLKRHGDLRGPYHVLLASLDKSEESRSWLLPFQEDYTTLFFFHRETDRATDYATIVGSSNGLICVYSYAFQVSNPFTKEHTLLPLFYPQTFAAYGFGYCPSTNEYKVACILYDSRFAETGQVQVYTLGSGTWRSKGEITHSWELNSPRGFFVNGTLYWMTTKMEMVCFSLEDEQIRVIRSPMPPPRRPPSVARNLVALGGCLCLVFVEETNVMDVWEMDNNLCWTEKISMPCKSTEDEAFALSESGKVLLHNSKGIVSCDPKAGRSTYIYKWQDSRSRREFIPYVASFISLEALGEEVVVREETIPTTTSDQIQVHSGSVKLKKIILRI